MLNLYIYVFAFILIAIFSYLCGSYFAYTQIENYVLAFILIALFSFLCGSYYVYTQIEKEDQKWEYSGLNHLHILGKNKQ